LLKLIVMIAMYVCSYLYVDVLFDMNSLRGIGVLTCMINLKTSNIWSLPYVRIIIPTYHD